MSSRNTGQAIGSRVQLELLAAADLAIPLEHTPAAMQHRGQNREAN
jgi:hypothetical protein